MKWRMTYTMSDSAVDMFRNHSDSWDGNRDRAVDFPLWRMAVESATNLAANGWANTKPRIRAVRQ